MSSVLWINSQTNLCAAIAFTSDIISKERNGERYHHHHHLASKQYCFDLVRSRSETSALSARASSPLGKCLTEKSKHPKQHPVSDFSSRMDFFFDNFTSLSYSLGDPHLWPFSNWLSMSRAARWHTHDPHYDAEAFERHRNLSSTLVFSRSLFFFWWRHS